MDSVAIQPLDCKHPCRPLSGFSLVGTEQTAMKSPDGLPNGSLDG